MGKTAFIFPGQGAQYAGMARDFWETFEESRRVFALAGACVQLPMEELIFEENSRLHQTEYTQIAMLTAEMAVLEAVRARGLDPDAAAGLSLGEYGALVVSGALSMEAAFRLVRKRGIYMQEAVPSGGAMAAVLGLSGEAAEDVLRGAEGAVYVANYNCPGQIVITGEEQAVQAASEALLSAGAKRVLPLKVSGPFHSPLLAGAGERLFAALAPVELGEFRIPYVSNVTADYVTEAGQVKDLLKLQVSSPVRWQQSVERLLSDGVDTFVELGPGKTLTGFLRKIDRGARAVSVSTVRDLERLALAAG